MTTNLIHTNDFFGCRFHDEVFVVKSSDQMIDQMFDNEMKTNHCSTKTQNKNMSTLICDNQVCDLHFIGSRSYDSTGALFMDTITQNKLKMFEFDIKWLQNVTQLTATGDLVNE